MFAAGRNASSGSSRSSTTTSCRRWAAADEVTGARAARRQVARRSAGATREIDGHDLAAARRAHWTRCPSSRAVRARSSRTRSRARACRSWRTTSTGTTVRPTTRTSRRRSPSSALVDEKRLHPRAHRSGRRRRPRIVFLTGDLGFKLFDDFAARYPGRFMNCRRRRGDDGRRRAPGSRSRERSRSSTRSPRSSTLRCYEQIRNDVCYHDADVTVVGVGGGYSYGPNGPTHHALEDIAVMRALPNMTVVCPGDPRRDRCGRARAGAPSTARPTSGSAGQASRRASRARRASRSARAWCSATAATCALLATGNMLATAVHVADLLAARGLGDSGRQHADGEAARHGDHRRRGRDAAPLIATLEEHSLIGGFGARSPSTSPSSGRAVRFRRFAAPDHFSHTCGDQEFHRAASGLDVPAIAAALAQLATREPRAMTRPTATRRRDPGSRWSSPATRTARPSPTCTTA